MSHCPHCECDECVEYFQNKSDREERQKVFESWNWNLTPAEVAQELDELMGYGAFHDEEEVFDHMVEFWDANTAEAVRDSYEVFC
jgi:hypothetical protein